VRKTLRITGLLTGVATAATAAIAFAGPAAATTGSGPGNPGGPNDGHAVFVQTDQTAGNQVAAYREDRDGTLTLAGTFATGGNGGVLATSVIDHLASQGSVTFDAQHQLLYVVNAGSNTVSVFSVHGTDLSLRQVVDSGGTFPVSVAVRNGVVYVLNALGGATIQGYYVVGDRLLAIPGTNRKLGLDPTQVVFTETPGQVSFSPDGSHLLVTTKANGNNIDVFAVDRFGRVSTAPVATNVAGGVPFAIAYDSRGIVEVAMAGTASVSSYRLNRDGTLTQLGATTSTGQAGTCWVISDGRLLFTTNPGAASVTSLAAGPAATASVITSTPTDPGTVDPAISTDGRYLYVETGAHGIVDEYAVHANGGLARIGSVTVANAAGAEGIATS
jgi:6-phosphogluconolactonase (cycloisomerase 2 family)